MRHKLIQSTIVIPALPAVIGLVGLAALSATGCKPAASEEHAATANQLERHQEFAKDMELVRRYDRGLEATLEHAESRPEIFPEPKGRVEVSAAHKHELREIHSSVIDRMRALDQVKSFWSGSGRINPVTNKRAHARAYLAGYAASLVQYRRGLDWVELTVPNDSLETILDEPSAAHDLPADSFGELKYRVIHVKEVSRLVAGYRYYKSLEDELAAANCGADPACRAAMELVETHYAAASQQLRARGLLDFSYNAWDIARDAGLKAWFPLQERVANWMGDTRVRRKHENLISRRQVAEMRRELEPGDIIVTRSNWYLSNVGLPGFWPHAELYVGSADELETYFDNEEVRAHFRQKTGHDGLAEYLRAEHPRAWRAYSMRDADGQPRRIIEARAEGVVFNSAYDAAGADYAAAMRPRRSRVAKAEAIAAAFANWGKAYDFNFDFLTDRELVCTELVYKAWQPGADHAGVDFELDYVMGRTTLAANNIVRQFDEGYDSDERDLDFVYFLDGREKKGAAVVSDLEAFRTSWTRPKWDVMQE